MAGLRLFSVWAPPVVWGPWAEVGSYNGIITYKIECTTLGKTKVFGQVQYFDTNGLHTQDFTDSITVTAGPGWATIKVRFYGIPLGSEVRVSITP